MAKTLSVGAEYWSFPSDRLVTLVANLIDESTGFTIMLQHVELTHKQFEALYRQMKNIRKEMKEAK